MPRKGGPVFVELMPLLAGRTVLITVAKVDDKTLRVNVIPALAKADDNPALSTPLTYTDPPRNSMLSSVSIWPAMSKPTSKPPAPWPKPKPPWRLPPRQHKRKRSAKPRSAGRQLRRCPTREPLPWRPRLQPRPPPHPQRLLRPRPPQHLRVHSGCSHLHRPNPLQINRMDVGYQSK
jgi:hypothetical protein